MEAECLVSIDGEQYARHYNDSPGWPHPDCELEAERAFRDAFVAAACEAAEWDFPDVEQVEAAWELRREARQRAQVLVTSAQLFNDPSLDDHDPPGTHFVYRLGHEVEASRARGRHHGMEFCRRDWWELADLNFDDDEEIRRLFMRPWVDAARAWANTPLKIASSPPEPLAQFSSAQWRAVLSKQNGVEHMFDTLEDAAADLKRRFGFWSEKWNCWDQGKTRIGHVFDWQERFSNTARLVARCGNRWVYYERDEAKQAPAAPARAIARRLITVPHEQLEWLWPGRIPLGKLTLLAGDPGLGKSFVTLDMAARVSTGAAWPDTSLLKQPAGGVILFNAEDDLADTIAPRLDRLGADDTMIVAVEGVEAHGQRRHFSLEMDLPRLEEVLLGNPDTRLVIIDPIAAYCGKVDSHKNTDVRGLLAPLANLASRQRVAIVAVTHLSKTGGNKAVYRAMGSLAFAAAARSVWAVVKDVTDPQKRLFLPAKLNLARDPDGLAYRIVEGRVTWESSPVKMHADDAFAREAAAAEQKTPRRGSERREAAEWLREQLAQGPMPTTDVIEMGEQFGFSERTLRRAYKEMGAKPKKGSFDGPWLWRVADQGGHEGGQDGHEAPLL